MTKGKRLSNQSSVKRKPAGRTKNKKSTRRRKKGGAEEEIEEDRWEADEW